METNLLVQQFKNIISDISDTEAFKYIQMGKGNLNLALNYYFNSQNKLAKSQQQSSKNVFSELMEGAKNQSKLEKIFNSLKQDYKKPIQSSITSNNIEKREDVAKNNHTLDLNTGNFQETPPRNDSFFEEKNQDETKKLSQNEYNSPHNEKLIKSSEFPMEESKLDNSQKSEEYDIIKTISAKRTYSDLMKLSSIEINDNINKINKTCLEKNIEREIEGFPKYLGESVIKGYALKNFNAASLKIGDELYLKRERKILIDEKKLKKKEKKNINLNKGFNDNIIRILTKNQEIGKIENEYAEILAPLLDENFITVEAFLIQIPTLVEAFSPIIFEIKVYLQSKSISKPITRVIDKGKFGEIDQESKILTYFDKTKQSFAGLFSLLSLKKTADTLIKINSIKRVPKQITEETINSDNPTKPSMSKINIRDPFQKLPKQASLLHFTQNIDKKPGQNSSSLQTTVQNSAISNENADSLDIDYEKVFKLDYTAYENLSMYKPPETFRSQLHPYQSKALTWMLKREGVLKEEDKEIKPLKMRTLHPLWEEYKLNDESCLFFNPYSGQVSLEFPHSTNSELKGGILADEMGLGKTVMMISLLHSNPDPRKHEKKEIMGLFQEKKMKIRGAGTLVIVPLTLLSQWEEEILTHSIPNYFRHVLYYGDVRPTNLENFDIVFTTYGVVSSEYANQKGELFNYTWFRIVLDEAHYIKGRTIQIAKAVYNLKGDSRWCMTGTPVQNKLDDLFSLIHFLRVEPWSDYLWWNSYINKPYEKKDNMVFDVIQTIIAPILLRRTKSTKDKNGQSIIDLPEKETIIEWVEFSKEEANLYKEVYQKSKKEFDDLLSKGTFLSNYMHVFDILTRLRQICDHPYLILTRSDYVNKEKLEETLKKFVDRRLTEKNSKTLQNTENDIPANHNQLPANHFEILYDEASNQEIIINLDKKKEHKFNEKYFEEVISKIKNNEIENCVVCLGEIEDAVITLCLHVTCRLCLIRSLESNGMCPFCRKLLTREDFMTVPRDSKFDIDLDSKFRRSSKLEKMMKNVARVMQLNEKIVIFSQFIGMLDLIEYDFKRNNIVYLRLDGSLSQKKRAEILTKFKEDPNIFIIMISLKAGGVGLNLVEANHVFLMDPWWNPAVEEQAVERVHRIGQKKKVEVIRFICKDSIEERMIELHKAKKELFNQTINMENGDRTMDKKKQNMEYFKYLMTNY